MNPIRLLAKMTARGAPLGVVGGGIGGVTRADVAAALAFAGVTPAAERLVRWLYCDERQLHGELVALLAADLRAQVVVAPGMLEQLVRLALHELDCAKPCRSCNGVHLGPFRECVVCGGTGIKPLSQRERAALLQVSDRTFRRSLQGHADAVYTHASTLVSHALRGLSIQFRHWDGELAA